jgi:type IV pilus assembly protein PilM
MRTKDKSSKGTFVGLDIGSSAVRAAEVDVDGDRRILRRFAQVGLPPGAVIDGEVIDTHAVSEALQRLWGEGGFSTKRVIVGVSSQRVIVRPAEVAAMSAEDFRLALQFEAQELIPIPVEEAVLDFAIIDPLVSTDPGSGNAGSGNAKMKIILVAAHRGMVLSHLAALKPLGLHPVAVDVVPLALLRATPTVDPSGVDAMVCLGADLTTVAIRQAGVASFTRTVNIGGSKLTNSIATELTLPIPEAEALKRLGGENGSVATVQEALRIVGDESRPILSEVDSSIDYFLAQSDHRRIDRVLVTGGASRTPGILPALSFTLGAEVELADPFAAVELGDLDLTDDQMDLARTAVLAPIGIALWGVEASGSRLSLLPPEIIRARRQRRMAQVATASVTALAVVLGGAWGVREMQVSGAKAQVASVTQGNRALQREVAALADVTQVQDQIIAQRALAVSALSGTVDWIRLLGQVSAVLPTDEWLTSFSATGTATAAGSAAPTAASPAAGTATRGTIQFQVSGKAGQDSVAQWLRALAKIPGLTNVWVGASANSGGTDTFASTASVTAAAPSSPRSAELPGAGQ